MSAINKMIGHFESKPKTQTIFQAIDYYIRSLGLVNSELKAMDQEE